VPIARVAGVAVGLLGGPDVAHAGAGRGAEERPAYRRPGFPRVRRPLRAGVCRDPPAHRGRIVQLPVRLDLPPSGDAHRRPVLGRAQPRARPRDPEPRPGRWPPRVRARHAHEVRGGRESSWHGDHDALRGVTQREALERYATYFIDGNRQIDGRNVSMGIGHQLPCVELRDLWSSFGQTAPPCEAFTATAEITHCPYDDWMSTGCKAGEPLEPGRVP
jgi:hypothetical protein